jgi:two-component system response regulator AtoC
MLSRAPTSFISESPLAPQGVENHVYVEAVSSGMRSIEQVIADIAPTDIPVLLLGESGTGKDAVALHIHRRSRRRQKPFRKLTCATLSPEWLTARSASEQQGEAGLGGGTLYLDEVGDLSAAGQANLLQALSDGELAMAGGLGTRLICATSRNLEEQLRAGRFREELYYRINGVCLRLPPLRHRREDIPALAEYFLGKYAAEFDRPQPALSAQASGRCHDHAWPGNIRELENAMKKIVVLGDERLAVADFDAALPEPRAAAPASAGISLKEAARAASRQAERELILKVLARTRWNRKRAATELKISYKALLYKLKQIGLEEAAGS